VADSCDEKAMPLRFVGAYEKQGGRYRPPTPAATSGSSRTFVNAAPGNCCGMGLLTKLPTAETAGDGAALRTCLFDTAMCSPLG
jgi:hypothetical protein